MNFFTMESFGQLLRFSGWSDKNILQKAFLFLACILVVFIPFIIYFNFFDYDKDRKDKLILGENVANNQHVSRDSRKETEWPDAVQAVVKDFIFTPIVAEDNERIIGGIIGGKCFFGVSPPVSDGEDCKNHGRLLLTVPLHSEDIKYMKGPEFDNKTIGQFNGRYVRKALDRFLGDKRFHGECANITLGFIGRSLYNNSLETGSSVVCLFGENEQDKIRGKNIIRGGAGGQASTLFNRKDSFYYDRCAVKDKNGILLEGDIENFEGVFIAHGICTVANGNIKDHKTLVQKSFKPIIDAVRDNYNLNVVVPLDYTKVCEEKRVLIKYVDFEVDSNNSIIKPFVVFEDGTKEYIDVAIGTGIASHSFKAKDEILKQLYELNLACKESFLTKAKQEEFYDNLHKDQQPGSSLVSGSNEQVGDALQNNRTDRTRG